MESTVKPRNHMRLSFPSLPENVSFARTTLAMFASQLGFTLDEIEEIKVASSEAVSNAVIHGYKDGGGIIQLTARLNEERLEACVIDEGRGIPDVSRACEPTFTTEPDERMGLGLVFIKEYMDEVGIDSSPGKGTTVRMAKRTERAKVRQ